LWTPKQNLLSPRTSGNVKQNISKFWRKKQNTPDFENPGFFWRLTTFSYFLIQVGPQGFAAGGMP
jgi:hypothetical protein